MTHSPDCTSLIKSFEQCRLQSYSDTVARPPVWTIGWGHTGPDVVANLLWTQSACDAQLDTDIDKCESVLNSAIKVSVTQSMYDALVSIVYNVGPGRATTPGVPGRDGIIILSMGIPSTLLRNLNARNYQGAAQQFPAWDMSGGVKVPGLLRRRQAEQVLFMKDGLPDQVLTQPQEPSAV